MPEDTNIQEYMKHSDEVLQKVWKTINEMKDRIAKLEKKP